MYGFENIYNLFYSFFEFLTFRHTPSYTKISDLENQDDFEVIHLNKGNKMIR
jgi:hypothetical protein